MNLPSPVEQISLDILKEKNITLKIKRDDLIHPEISGNKWRKLKYNISQFKLLKKEHLLTFGGPFSNHIAATAASCEDENISCIGIIRGEEADMNNPTLSFAVSKGMKIIPVSRTEYDWKKEEWYHDELRDRFGDLYIVPEGGANYYGVNGCMEIMQEVDEHFDYVCVAAGTGTTAAGILLSLKNDSTLLVFPALKGGDFLYDEIKNLIRYTVFDEEWTEERMKHLKIITDYHFGGYAKYNDDLISFMKKFYYETGIKTDFIYTAKMTYGILDLIKNEFFKSGSKILIVHTGGLQGNIGADIHF